MHRIFHLLEREQQGVPRDPAYNRVDDPANRDRDVPAEGNRLQFNIDATVSLLEPGKAVDTPDVAAALVRWKFLLVRPAVVPNLLHARGMRGAVPAEFVELQIAGLVFSVERSLGYSLLVHHAHRVLVAAPFSTERLGIDNCRFVKFIVVTVITDRRQHVSKPGVGDEGCPYPIVD